MKYLQHVLVVIITLLTIPTTLLNCQPISIQRQNQAVVPSQTLSVSLPILYFQLDDGQSINLYATSLTPPSAQLITQNIQNVPAFSPDHTRIAVAKTTTAGDAVIDVVSLDGLNVKPIYTTGPKDLKGQSSFNQIISNLSWSPDGKYISFRLINHSSTATDLDNTQIGVIDLEGTLIESFQDNNTDLQPLTWLSPDGFMYEKIEQGCQALYNWNIKTRSSHFLAGCANLGSATVPTASYCETLHVGLQSGSISDVQWSSDVQHVVLALDATDLCTADILAFNVATGAVYGLPYRASSATLSPDASTIAYIERTDDQQLCFVRFDGSNNHCVLPTEDAVTGRTNIWQMRWILPDTIAMVISHQPDSGEDPQICLLNTNTLKQTCLTDVLTGFASIVGATAF